MDEKLSPLVRLNIQLILKVFKIEDTEENIHKFIVGYNLNNKALSNQSPPVRTSPKGDFSNEKEHNISLKDNSNELSQISSNDETSLNNNIKRNFTSNLASKEQPTK